MTTTITPSVPTAAAPPASVSPPVVVADLSTELTRDQQIELKETIVDGLLNLTYQRCSGEGRFGEYFYKVKPSRQLSSGFLLPSFDPTGVIDETNDIWIATQGLDFQVKDWQSESVLIQPFFNIYVRVLPTAEDIFDKPYGLKPIVKLVPAIDRAIKIHVQNQIKIERAKIEGKMSSTQYVALKTALFREACEANNIVFRSSGTVTSDTGLITDDQDSGETGETKGNTEVTVTGAVNISLDDAMIPDAIAMGMEIPEKWKRLEVPIDAFQVPITDDHTVIEPILFAAGNAMVTSIVSVINAWLASPEGLDWAWRQTIVAPSNLENKDAWNAFLARVRLISPNSRDLNPNITPALSVTMVADPLMPRILNVGIALDNVSNDGPMESAIFQTCIKVTLSKKSLHRMQMERVKPSYHLLGYMDHPAIGLNCGVEEIEGEKVTVLQTTWLPRYMQPRMVPRAVKGVVIDFETLMNPATDFSGLKLLVSEYDRWISELPAIINPDEGIDPSDFITITEERNRFSRDIEAYKCEREMIADGIELLEFSKCHYEKDKKCLEGIPYRAWLATNRTFRDAGVRKGAKSWRLFQLAFVVGHIPTIASRMDKFKSFYKENRDDISASLLFFAAGGGKTEAFFGILTFALFTDRMKGKNIGITAMIRYPLRLLTLQQSQRLMRLIAYAERLRCTLKLGGRPFEIGFWVGRGNTPNQTNYAGTVIDDLKDIPVIADLAKEDEAKIIRDNPPYEATSKAYNKMPTCPFCDGITVLRIFPKQHHRLGIVCKNKGCWWNLQAGGWEPLPFLLVDDDIYNRAPSILLGTIDKLALLGNSERTIQKIAGMFGMAKLYHPLTGTIWSPPNIKEVNELFQKGGYETIAPSYDTGVHDLFVDPFPSIIIQDEAHLLEESLGAFASLFETALNQWFVALGPILGKRVARRPDERIRLPKIIAATATVSDPGRQVGTLYQKHVMQFPHPGPRLYGSFYSELDKFDDPARGAMGTTPILREKATPWMRAYSSIMTNGNKHTVSTISVLTAFHLNISMLVYDFASGDSGRQQKALDSLLGALTKDILYQRHRDILMSLANSGRYGVIATVVDLHRIAITYVTNKKGGDQILSVLPSAVRNAHIKEEYPLEYLHTELISGGVDAKRIQEVIEMSEKTRKSGETFGLLDAELRGIVATSAISHGVDVDRFNSMFFAGMPTDVAEYIQASARVGRTHVGFSLLIPVPQTRRDRYIVDVHDIFHRFLERMIAVPAIERWADKAILRVIPSMFQNYLFGVLQQEIFANATGNKSACKGLGLIDLVRSEIARQSLTTFVINATHHIMTALGVDSKFYGAPNADHYKDLIRNEVHRLCTIIHSESISGTMRDFWNLPSYALMKPMMSLRDVDEMGIIVPATRTVTNAPITHEKISTIMQLVRNRYSPVSEIDSDGAAE